MLSKIAYLRKERDVLLMSVEEEGNSKSIADKKGGDSQPLSTELTGENSSLSSKVEAVEIKTLRKELDDIITALRKDLENERKRNLDLSKRMLYLQSDFANLQRQSERRIEEAKDETKLRFIEELISVKEDLERAMSVAKASNSLTLFDGLRMLLSRIEGSLRSEEVERINASLGSTFDPRLHEAVAYSEGEAEKEGTILSVVSNGYTMRGKVIKPALVEVARQNQGLIQRDQGQEIRDERLHYSEESENHTEKQLNEHPLESRVDSKEKES
jgi:molecular chaperone GrpE